MIMEITKKMYVKDITLVQAKVHEKIKSVEDSTKLTLLEIMSLQHELDDEQLTEWREKRSKQI
jgi:hypothetical protein